MRTHSEVLWNLSSDGVYMLREKVRYMSAQHVCVIGGKVYVSMSTGVYDYIAFARTCTLGIGQFFCLFSMIPLQLLGLDRLLATKWNLQINFNFVWIFQRCVWYHTCGSLHSVVFDVSVEALCDCVFNGPSTDFDCLSMCIIVWCFCVDYDILEQENFIFFLKPHVFWRSWEFGFTKIEDKMDQISTLINRRLIKTQWSIVLS